MTKLRATTIPQMIVQTRFSDLYEMDKSVSDYYTNPLIIGAIVQPRAIAVPTTPHAVPNLLESAKTLTELQSTVQIDPDSTLIITKKITTTTQCKVVISESVEFGRTQRRILPTSIIIDDIKIMVLLQFGFYINILPKTADTIDPRTQGISSKFPVKTYSNLNLCTIRSLRLEKSPPRISSAIKIVKLTIQNKGSISIKQLHLNYSYCYCCYDSAY